jgi:parallel beta-helix repeat protein
MRIAMGLVLVLVSPLSVASASTINVPLEYSGIQTALFAASYGDTVLVGPGVHSGHIALVNGVTLISEDGPEVTILDAGYQGSVITAVSADANTAVIGFTIRHGVAPETNPYGGGLHLIDSDILIRDNVIWGNTAEVGGGICVRGLGHAPRIWGNQIRANHATDHAGGICADHGSLLAWDNVIEENTTSGCAGGISIRWGEHAILTNNLILNNTADRGAGGIYLEHTHTIKISRCTISGNVASATHGGGINLYQSSATIEWSLIENNWCLQRGGGILWLVDSSIDLRNNTIVGNHAAEGGGIFAGDALSALVRNNIISGSTGGGVFVPPGGFIELTCNNIWGNQPQDCWGAPPGMGGFSEDPLFCKPHLGDYHLSLGSPCLNGYGCGLVGAFDEGCGTTRTEETTWGLLKAMYR